MMSTARMQLVKEWFGLSGSQTGLRRLLHLILLLFLVVASCVLAFSLPASASLHDNRSFDTIASIVLLGALCLHLVAVLNRKIYSGIDIALDAVILMVASLILRSPILANVAFYVVIAAVASLLPSRRLIAFVLVMLLSSLLAVLGLSLIFAGEASGPERHLFIAFSWQFFCINVVGFPAAVYFVFSLIYRLREENAVSAKETPVPAAMSPAEAPAVTAIAAPVAAPPVSEKPFVPAAPVPPVVPPSETARKLLGPRVSVEEASSIFAKPLAEEELPLIAVIAEFCQLIQRECNRGRCDLITTLSGHDLRLYGDPTRFMEVLRTLVSFAVHSYGDATGKTERPIYLSVEDAGLYVLVEIMDRGPGIPDECLPIITEFLTSGMQEANAENGLAIARRIVVENFGGTIEVKSTVGQGTTFTLTFPKRNPKKKSA